MMDLTREQKIDLFEIYNTLLAEKQQEYFRLYYLEDWSLGEIAENFKISRQAVLAAVDNAIANLINYENGLNLLSKKKLYMKNIDELEDAIKKNKKEKKLLKMVKKLRSIYV
jgi:hypothetical protein